MKRRKIIPYNPKLKEYARKLRKDSTFTEIMVWNNLKGKQVRGYDPAYRQAGLIVKDQSIIIS